MPGILDLMGYIDQKGQEGRARGQQTALGRLYGQAAQAPRDQRAGLLGQIGAISPQAAFDAEDHFGKMDDSARENLGQYAAAFSALPAEQKAAAYPQLAEMGRSLGLPVPQGDYQPAYDQGISQLAQAFAGGGSALGVQSTYIDAQGNRVAIMRDGSTQVLGQNAPQNQIIDTGNGFFGVNKGNLQAAPVTVGGQQPYTIDPSLPPEVQAAIRSDPNAGSPQGIQSLPQQLQKAPAAITPYQQAQLGAQQQRLQIAQQARDEAAAARKAAEDARNAQKQAVIDQRQSAAAEAANQLISSIDSLTEASGFGDLGTVGGDIKINTPLIRSDAKDADAQLKNIAGQVALTTMSRLKALSSQGATGFGSLSAPELKLLQNSIATLQSDSISHEQLVRSLKVIRDSMGKIATWKPSQQAAPSTAGGWKVEVVQ